MAGNKGKNNYLIPRDGGVVWGPMIRGVLIKRYKRFLADVKLGNGHVVTAHSPNTGSMKTCSEPGRPVWLSRHDNPKRKLKYTWEMIEMPDSLVGINTAVPNLLVKTAVEAGCIEPLSGYDSVRREVKVSDHTRLDLVLEGNGRPACYVEIKNSTLVEGGLAEFPDAVTERGRKHLEALAELAANGNRAVIFFLVQRSDAQKFGPADRIDPEYGRVLRKVVSAGVEALAYDVVMDQTRIDIRRPVPIKL